MTTAEVLQTWEGKLMAREARLRDREATVPASPPPAGRSAIRKEIKRLVEQLDGELVAMRKVQIGERNALSERIAQLEARLGAAEHEREALARRLDAVLIQVGALSERLDQGPAPSPARLLALPGRAGA